MSEGNASPPSRRRSRPLAVGCALFIAIGTTVMFALFSRWSDVRDALPPEAEQAFSAARQEAGGGPAYIEIASEGVVVNRDLEHAEPVGFAKLKVLAWSVSEQKLIRVEYPRWFVQMKISWGPNLGTMISALRGDLGHLDLSVKYRDLQRLGPGLVLDHTAQSGSRIMLWTVAD
jgi:hypothetical protein